LDTVRPLCDQPPTWKPVARRRCAAVEPRAPKPEDTDKAFCHARLIEDGFPLSFRGTLQQIRDASMQHQHAGQHKLRH
jgi:hypothetical protein